ncbi:hypothetical protein F0562_024973 [Nyssa sinensis]|uniref:Uncharacterized protein n=1 Tax=Nyssa sinensis TaxID=561372 RepID=A0A5J5BDV8_9ASTE|nr:hypothetical protein F0562_024973 [Nyssa sinensis]
MNKKSRSKRSLCEKSMKIVANIVKLSSFSIAKISLGTAGPPPRTKNLASFDSDKVVNDPLLPRFPGSRSQEPQCSSKSVSYLIEPIEGNEFVDVICEEKSIDGRASAYITKVHEKNRHDLN